MNAKKALRKFMEHIAAAPEGAHFEIGTVWDPRKGWRVYERVGDKGLAMSSDDARALFRTFEKTAAMPQWLAIAATMRDTFEGLRTCADEVDRLNREKVVPPDVLAAATAGHA